VNLSRLFGQGRGSRGVRMGGGLAWGRRMDGQAAQATIVQSMIVACPTKTSTRQGTLIIWAEAVMTELLQLCRLVGMVFE